MKLVLAVLGAAVLALARCATTPSSVSAPLPPASSAPVPQSAPDTSYEDYGQYDGYSADEPDQPDIDCDENYEPCVVPQSKRDLDCPDIPTSVKVVGRDVHNFDRDGDGYGCETNPDPSEAQGPDYQDYEPSQPDYGYDYEPDYPEPEYDYNGR